MPTFTYHKQCNLRVLGKELAAAGFATPIGLTQNDDGTWTLIVNLPAGETKDPTSIVNAHVYTEDLQPDLVTAMDTIRAKYIEAHDAIVAATTIATMKQALIPLGDCLKWTGRLLYHQTGTMPLNDNEYLTGDLDLER